MVISIRRSGGVLVLEEDSCRNQVASAVSGVSEESFGNVASTRWCRVVVVLEVVPRCHQQTCSRCSSSSSVGSPTVESPGR